MIHFPKCPFWKFRLWEFYITLSDNGTHHHIKFQVLKKWSSRNLDKKQLFTCTAYTKSNQPWFLTMIKKSNSEHNFSLKYPWKHSSWFCLSLNQPSYTLHSNVGPSVLHANTNCSGTTQFLSVVKKVGPYTTNNKLISIATFLAVNSAALTWGEKCSDTFHKVFSICMLGRNCM